MKPLLDSVGDLSSMNEKAAALVVDVDGFNSADSDNERSPASVASDTDLSEPDVPTDPEQAKRNAQAAAFTKHLKGQQTQDKPESSFTSMSGNTNHLMKDFEADSARIIDMVRDYQQEMFERAKAENIIAV
jgi:hypothetical protein